MPGSGNSLMDAEDSAQDNQKHPDYCYDCGCAPCECDEIYDLKCM